MDSFPSASTSQRLPKRQRTGAVQNRWRTVVVDLSDPAERSRHLADPGAFAAPCRRIPADRERQRVFVDEAQNVPTIVDAIQHLYDREKSRWRFVLCGSSARKLRKTGANLLPGRSFWHHLYPLTLAEHPPATSPIRYAVSPLPFEWPGGAAPGRPFPAWDLETRLAYGSLPGVVASDEQDRAALLKAFAPAHLEEEIRREALVKEWGAFVRFLRLAAAESGQIVNYAGIARETGLSQPTVKSHYQLLEDRFIGFRIRHTSSVVASDRWRSANRSRLRRGSAFDHGLHLISNPGTCPGFNHSITSNSQPGRRAFDDAYEIRPVGEFLPMAGQDKRKCFNGTRPAQQKHEPKRNHSGARHNPGSLSQTARPPGERSPWIHWE